MFFCTTFRIGLQCFLMWNSRWTLSRPSKNNTVPGEQERLAQLLGWAAMDGEGLSKGVCWSLQRTLGSIVAAVTVGAVVAEVLQSRRAFYWLKFGCVLPVASDHLLIF